MYRLSPQERPRYGPGEDLAAQMRGYLGTLEAFREVAAVAETLAGEHALRDKIHRSLPRFSDSIKENAVRTGLEATGRLIKASVDGSIGVEEAEWVIDERGIVDTGSEYVHMEVHEDPVGTFKGGSVAFSDSDVQSVVNAFMMDLVESVLGSTRRELVLSSLLTSLVGAFDKLVGDLATIYYRLHPDALGSDPEFSLADLGRFETMDEAREELIQRKVDAMDQGLDGQVKWFTDHLNIDLRRLAEDWDSVLEIVQRRHVVVHAGSRATGRYLRKLGDPDGVTRGERLRVDIAYLADAIDQFAALGVNLVFAQWYVLLEEEREVAAGSLLRAAARSARARRWRTVQCLCGPARRLKGPAETTHAFSVLAWLAAKHLDGPQAIEEDVRRWDVSALAKRWRLARQCLLGEVEDAATLAEELIGGGEVLPMAILTDPLYEDLREFPNVASAIGTRGFLIEGSAAKNLDSGDTITGEPA